MTKYGEESKKKDNRKTSRSFFPIQRIRKTGTAALLGIKVRSIRDNTVLTQAPHEANTYANGGEDSYKKTKAKATKKKSDADKKRKQSRNIARSGDGGRRGVSGPQALQTGCKHGHRGREGDGQRTLSAG